MREILFRGKRLDNGEWVEGDLLQYSTMTVIQVKEQVGNLTRIEAFPVDPETVSQYIGRKDNKDRRIYEGDIVLPDDLVYGEGGCFLIQWNEDWNGWDANRVGAKDDIYTIVELGDMEIVGNIWDNKELLGGETQEGPDR